MMHPAILWKEYREHRSVWLALAVLNAAALLGVGLGWGFEHDGGRLREFMCLVAAILTWTYGVVCGSILLAGETEAGTQPWLDTLPAGRSLLWRSKCLAGALFVVAQTALVFGVGAAVGVVPRSGDQLGGPAPQSIGHLVWLALLLVCGLTGFGWGMFFSAQARTALASIGLAVLAQMAVGPVVQLVVYFFLVLAVLALGIPEPPHLALAVFAAVVGCLVPLLLSLLVYARDDLRRGTPRRVALPDWGGGLRVAFRLAWAQTRGLMLGLAVGALAAGLLVAANFAVLWPLLSLAVGVVCGATAYLDEQGGAYRFLGDQRLPLTRIWLAKLVLRGGLALLGSLLLLLPAVAFHTLEGAKAAHSTIDDLFDRSVPLVTGSPATFLTVWVCYGFATGHLCGLLFRKPLVAVVVASGLALLAACVWVPSLAMGGVRPWQVLAVPLVLLLGSRWLLRPWASDRLASRPAAGRLAVLILLCVGATALGLGGRAFEIPEATVPPAYQAYLDSLPAEEDNEAGRIGRDACQRVGDLRRGWMQGQPPKLFAQEGDTTPHYAKQVELVCKHGWPDRADALGGWLDKAFDDPVWAKFESLRDLPTGVIDDPRRMTSFANNSYDSGHLAALTLLARGLQMQKKGKPEVFVANLETALALSRNLENRSRASPSHAVELRAVNALTHWLEDLGDDGPLLRRALAALRKHRPSIPADYDWVRHADYLIAVNSLDRVQEWLPVRLLGSHAGRSDLEPAAIEMAARVPWERERLERQMRYLHWGLPEDMPGRQPVEWPSWARDWGLRRREALRVDPRRPCQFDGMTLVVALRLYQAEKGKPADALDRLVPAYLPALPADAVSKQPFRYRLSRGEEIEWPEDAEQQGGAGGGVAAPPGAAPGPGMAPPQGMPPVPGLPMAPGEGQPPMEVEKVPTRAVKSGQGIVWSVGEDGNDDGGKRQAREGARCKPGEDILFIVPLPKK